MKEDELIEAWCKYRGKCSTEIMQALAFALRWCDRHPNWVSVEDELPPRFKLNPRESINVITYGLHTMVNWYDYKLGKWKREDTEVTHWMPLPQPPVVSNSENTGKKGGKAWLEKQGEQKPVDMSIKEKAHQIAWEMSKDYDPLLSKEAWCEMAALDMAFWLKKQD